MAERTESGENIPPAHKLLAELDLLDGRPEAAAARLEPLVEEYFARQNDYEDSYSYRLPLMLARVYLAFDACRDRLERAGAMAARSVREARERSRRSALADALWVHGMTLARLGREDEAERALLEALADAREHPSPHREARVLFELGRLRMARGRENDAERDLHEALTIFERLGAAPEEEATAAMLSVLV
jgi:tetratricopeptide (TPR) repeat protein